MKTNQIWNAERGTRSESKPARAAFRTPHSALRTCEAPSSALRPPLSGFTLIELLAVIAIIGALAALTLVVVGGVAKTKYRSIATAEMNQIENALEDYKAKYGVYPPCNANPAGTYTLPQTNPVLPQLYYELSGVTNNGLGYFVTLDGSAKISVAQAQAAFGTGGFINCWKGGGDDSTPAKNFLPGLKANRTAQVTDNGVPITILVTSVNGPDAQYTPLGAGNPNVNPFRYVYPGVNNPSSYDLYVELVISRQTNLICNWGNKPFTLNTSLP